MNPPTFPAIVLTHDRTTNVRRHMIARYRSVWPDHPFRFRIPYQNASAVTDDAECEFVPSPPGIKQTVETLIADLDDEAWIYWCIDDKYPVDIDLGRIRPIVDELAAGGPDDVSGVLFCRVRQMLDERKLLGNARSLGGETLLDRRAYDQIWIHQFLRVKVLRHLFGAFPDIIQPAKIMDRLKRRVTKPSDHRLWVTAECLAAFGESSFAGVLTENCVASMQASGLPIPDWQPAVSAEACLIGEVRRTERRAGPREA